MQEKLKPLLAALATACAVSSAHGVTLGELQVQSALGERLEARVRVTAAPGETVDASCFSLLPEVPQGLSAVPGLQAALEPGGEALRLTSRGPVNEPAAALALRAACAGSPTESVREYVLLLDPLPAGTTAVVRARRGESLQSLARTLVQAPGPRREYLVAMRAANPSLAGVGDREPLTEGTTVVLPDLRPAMRPPARAPQARPGQAKAAAAAPNRTVATEPRTAATPDAPSSRAELPRTAEKPPVATARRPAEKPAVAATPRARPEAPPSAARPLPAVAAPRAPTGGRDAFVLKLSSSPVDLAPSREVSDAQRQQLRERLLLLDSDDQVSALLAMRHSLKQLENRVAELQLKLAAMPQSFPERAAAPKTEAPAIVPEPAKPLPEAAKPLPEPAKPLPEAAKPPPEITRPVPELPKPEQVPEPIKPPIEPVAKAAPAEVAPVESAPVESAPVETATPEARDKRAAKPAPPKPSIIGEWHLPDWAWAAVAALVLLVAWLVLRMRRREEEPVESPPTDLREPALQSPQPEADADAVDLEVPAMPSEPGRQAVDSDSMLTTRLRDNSGDLRRRYIEERFPEVINGTIRLDDADSVIKGARLFFEDGATTRAIELLQFAIEDHPGNVKVWLALFEIFRLERLSGEYAELSGRFQRLHDGTDAWRKVRYFGRELDPANALYREEPVNTLETIGPRESRRLAAALAAVDPIAENWLNAPMDFENEVLANELRNALMAQAQLKDQDLAPNPMPALRNVEMFTVA